MKLWDSKFKNATKSVGFHRNEYLFKKPKKHLSTMTAASRRLIIPRKSDVFIVIEASRSRWNIFQRNPGFETLINWFFYFMISETSIRAKASKTSVNLVRNPPEPSADPTLTNSTGKGERPQNKVSQHIKITLFNCYQLLLEWGRRNVVIFWG